MINIHLISIKKMKLYYIIKLRYISYNKLILIILSLFLYGEKNIFGTLEINDESEVKNPTEFKNEI